MAGQPQPNQAARDGNDETAPLLRPTNKPQGDATSNGRRGNAAYAAEGESSHELADDDIRLLRRRRWVSLIASILLIIAFVVILFLAGGK